MKRAHRGQKKGRKKGRKEGRKEGRITEDNSTIKMATECGICFEEYKRRGSHTPKMLPMCLHTVCLLCLQHLRDNNNRITCPECRVVSIVPPGGVQAFATDRFVFQAAEREAELEATKLALEDATRKLEAMSRSQMSRDQPIPEVHQPQSLCGTRDYGTGHVTVQQEVGVGPEVTTVAPEVDMERGETTEARSLGRCAACGDCSSGCRECCCDCCEGCCRCCECFFPHVLGFLCGVPLLVVCVAGVVATVVGFVAYLTLNLIAIVLTAIFAQDGNCCENVKIVVGDIKRTLESFFSSCRERILACYASCVCCEGVSLCFYNVALYVAMVMVVVVSFAVVGPLFLSVSAAMLGVVVAVVVVYGVVLLLVTCCCKCCCGVELGSS